MGKNLRLMVWGPIGALLIGMALYGSAAAQTQTAATTDENQLEAREKEMDEAAPAAPKESKVDALAKQFNVPASTVDGMRDKGQGWGEISIELSMAQHLVKTDPKTYPTLNDALTKLDSMRADGRGWGNISKELGFKLGPVISDVKRAHQATLRVANRSTTERTGGSEEGARAERHGRPERLEHLRPERPERAERGGESFKSLR
ncbi:MAG: hypothetical protein HYZ93_03600 [Candidatus Omnitrophica bacterium]|nr:hypothetical protein [Candidatus Omnitrophota bacterium]